jgi:hypothetical protein
MSLNWTILHQWQSRALEGMLQALEPRVNLDRGPALSPRLQTMLEKHRKFQSEKGVKENVRKLGERLTQIQEEKKTGT